MKRREKLDGKQITELQQMIQSKKSDNIELKRAQAILLINSNADEFMIRSITGFDKKYAFKLKKRFQERGTSGIATKKKKSRLLLTAKQLDEIKHVISEKRPNEIGVNADFWTTLILAEYIKENFNVVYKSRTSYRLLFKQSGFTYHKPEKHYHAQNKASVDKWDTEVAPKIKGIVEDPESIVLVGDEMILTTQTTTQKVWLLPAAPAIVETSNKREKRCIYGFLDVKTGREYSFKTSHTNSFTTCKILGKLSRIFAGKKITIVWDNASWHKSDMIKKYLTKHPDKFHLFTLPPYSPEKNPQEHVWKAGRENVTHNKFIENIDAATNEFIKYLNSKIFAYEFL